MELQAILSAFVRNNPHLQIITTSLERAWALKGEEGLVGEIAAILDRGGPAEGLPLDDLRAVLMHMEKMVGVLLAQEALTHGMSQFDAYQVVLRGVDLILAGFGQVMDVSSFAPLMEQPVEMATGVLHGVSATLVDRRIARLYSVRRDLCTALHGTRLRGLTQGDIELPEPSVFVHLDDGKDSFCVIIRLESKGGEGSFGFSLGCPSEHGLFTGFSSIIPHRTSLEALYDSAASQSGAPISGADILATVNNALLYITNNEHDVVRGSLDPEREALRARMLRAKGPKREKLKARLREIPEFPVFTVGGTYTIDKRLTEGTGLATGRHLNVRFIVAGHWRQQPCGAGGRQRKLIWIAPHWKGPELAPVTRSVGIVRQPVGRGL